MDEKTPIKRGRGRPRKIRNDEVLSQQEMPVKRSKRASSKRARQAVMQLVKNDEDLLKSEENDDDFVMPLGGEPEEEPLEEAEELAEVNNTKTKRRIKRSKTESDDLGIELSTENTTDKTVKRSMSKLESKGRIIRSLKDLSSARDKIERLYGLNREKLLQLAKVKLGYQTSLFDFPEENLLPDSPCYVNCVRPSQNRNLYEDGMNQTIYADLSKSEFASLYNLSDEAAQVVIGDTELLIGIDERYEFPVLKNTKRDGFIYNTGGLVTDMVWLNKEGAKQYLIVAASQYKNQPVNCHLRMFTKENHISSLQVFEFDTEKLTFTKKLVILHQHGESWDLKWHEGTFNDQSMGLLGFISQNGNLHFIEIPTRLVTSSELQYVRCDKTSITISLPNTSLTCFDFWDDNSIICGCSNGYISQFELLETKVPSIYQKVHDSYILSVIVAYSSYNETNVASTISVDGFQYMFNLECIFTTRSMVTRFRGSNISPMVYSSQLNAFVLADGTNTLKTVVPRAAFSIQPVASLENTITSLAISRLHPMVLFGGADGSLMINNLARRLLTGVKNNSNTNKFLKLWKWDYNPHLNKYRLQDNYEVHNLVVNELSKATINPHGVMITNVKWNETSHAGKFYSFVNAAGLLVIEKLGSSV